MTIPRCIHECLACGMWYVSPRPTAAELAEYYSGQFEDAYREAGVDYIGGSQTTPGYLRERLQNVEARLGGPGVLVDVGAGAGAFAGYAAGRGWRVIGTEISESSARRTRALYGLDMRIGEIGSVGISDESVDAVHMNHVLEHVVEPRQTLVDARRLLRPDGILVVEVPFEFAGPVYHVRRLLGRVRPYEVPSPHLWFFRPEPLRRLVREVGFQLLSLETPRREVDGPVTGRTLAKRVVHVLERRFERGPLIVAVARKHS